MRLACPDTRSRRGGAALLLVGLAVAVAGRLIFWAHPFINDSGLYICMGKTVAEGGKLYHDFYETKFPGVALLAAGCWEMFGGWWPGYVLLQLGASLLVTAVMVSTLRRRIGSDAAVSAGAFMLVLFNFAAGVFGGFQLETLQSSAEVLSACAAITSLSSGSRRSPSSRPGEECWRRLRWG